MAQMHSQFETAENQQTAISVTRDGEANSYGVTLVVLHYVGGMWQMLYTTTFGAYVTQERAEDLYGKMANAMSYRGYREIKV